MSEIADTFDSAFTKAVDLGNRLADKDKDADLWDIADGLLAGALQYWLYSRQPCGDPRCQDCMPISTAEGRMAELKRLMEQLASESEYFHTPTDANAGRRGLILLSCGIYGNVIRFLAPLTIPDALLKEGFNIFEQALDEVSRTAAVPA